ncbi:ribosomal protein S8 [Atractiella rhizophila]|nr:ribosomal protein S8 [Atractiella rhizophila]
MSSAVSSVAASAARYFVRSPLRTSQPNPLRHSRLPVLPHLLLNKLATSASARLSHVSLPFSNVNLSVLSLLHRHGFISSLSLGSTALPSPKAFVEAKSPKDKALWVSLKVRDETPVIRDARLVSKPGRRVVLDADEVRRFVGGKRVRFVRGAKLGEVILIHNGRLGWLEGREAVRKGVGGEVVARVGSFK